MAWGKKKQAVQQEPEPLDEDWDDNEPEMVQTITPIKRINPEASKPQIKAIQRGIEREAIESGNKIEYVAVPRAVPQETMLNEIFDEMKQQSAIMIEVRDMLVKINKEMEND
jgi:hypothetical protein